MEKLHEGWVILLFKYAEVSIKKSKLKNNMQKIIKQFKQNFYHQDTLHFLPICLPTFTSFYLFSKNWFKNELALLKFFKCTSWQNEKVLEEKGFILLWLKRKFSFRQDSNPRSMDYGTNSLPLSYLTCWRMGIKVEHNQVQNSLFTNQLSVHNCHKMTKIAATLASIDGHFHRNVNQGVKN